MTLAIPAETVGDRLRRAFRFVGLTTAEVAEYVDVQPTTVSSWVSGRMNPRTSMLRLLAIRCGVPYEWLRDGSDEPVAMMQARVIAAMSERFPEMRADFSGFADELGVATELAEVAALPTGLEPVTVRLTVGSSAN